MLKREYKVLSVLICMASAVAMMPPLMFSGRSIILRFSPLKVKNV